MKTRYEFIHFAEVPPAWGKRTRLFDCLNNRSKAALGYVMWYAPWRQYCFYPLKETIFSGGCLKDIEAFLEELMTDHKTRLANAKHNHEAQLAE